MLTNLDLSNNQISGSIPGSWGGGQLTLLRSVKLGNNNLTGQVPESWGKLDGLSLSGISLDALSSVSLQQNRYAPPEHFALMGSKVSFR